MDPDRAHEIIQALANGKDPYTGDALPASSVYQQADTVRALYLALEGLDRLKRSKARKTDGPPMSGQPWTTEEEQEVLRDFDAKIDVNEIAAKHQRTTGAIWSRLEKLGRISPDRRRGGEGAEPSPRAPHIAPPSPTVASSDIGDSDLPF